MRYCASRPSPAVDAKAMSVDIHRVAAASGSEGLTLMLEEFRVGRPKERDEISYEFPRRPFDFLSYSCYSFQVAESRHNNDA